MIRSRSHALLVRSIVAAIVSAFVVGVAAAGAGASTLAYVNTTNGNTYVTGVYGPFGSAGPFALGAHEVATGVTSPALASNGTLYALAGNQVDVFEPGVGAQTPIPISGNGATQLTVSPDGTSLAYVDGSLASPPTSVNILTPATGTTQTLANGLNAEWASSGLWTVSVADPTDPSELGTYVASYDGSSTTPIWYPQDGIYPNGFAVSYQYAVNSQRTLAATVVVAGAGPRFSEQLIVFPIGPNLGPAGNPLVTGVGCGIGGVGAGKSMFNPSTNGPNFAWSPSGTAIAYNSNGGISVAAVGPWNSDCSQIGTPRVLVRNGTSPSWGPSNARTFPPPASAR